MGVPCLAQVVLWVLLRFVRTGPFLVGHPNPLERIQKMHFCAVLMVDLTF